jgi:hypothetical protein
VDGRKTGNIYILVPLALIAEYHSGRMRLSAMGLEQMAIYFAAIACGFGGYIADALAFAGGFVFNVGGDSF